MFRPKRFTKIVCGSVLILFALIATAANGQDSGTKTAKSAGSTLRIVNDLLSEHDGFYFCEWQYLQPK
jgi:hypothetical protein